MDTVSPERRSAIMSRVRSKNTKPEVAVRRVLHRLGYRFRLHARLPGKPDVVLPRWKAVVLVHGCFWHRHAECPMTRTPKSKVEFWDRKFRRNVDRDAESVAALEAMGWRVLVVWECQILEETALAKTLKTFIEDGRVVSWEPLPVARPSRQSSATLYT